MTTLNYFLIVMLLSFSAMGHKDKKKSSSQTQNASFVVILNESINSKPKGVSKTYEIQKSGQYEYEFVVQNGDGLDYFPKVCTGNFINQIFCKIENLKKAIYVKIDRPTDLEIKINDVVVLNRSTFPAEKGQVKFRKQLTGKQKLSLFSRGLPTSSTSLKIKKFQNLNLPPLASFTFSASSFIEPSLVSFSALASSDPDGAIESYNWDFGDQTQAEGALVQHQFNLAGSYNVKLSVVDNRGAQTVVSQTVVIHPDVAQPVLSSIVPVSGSEISLNNFIISGLSSERLSSVSVRINNQFYFEGSINNSNLSFEIPVNLNIHGQINAVISATDLRGNQSSVSNSYFLSFNSPPIANIQVLSSSSEFAPSMLWFDASQSSDPDQDALTYHWDFGNGQSSSEIKPTQLLQMAGVHTITLTVRDSFGASHSVSKEIALQEISLPQAPEEIATPIAEGATPSKSEKYNFLYSAENPTQKDVVTELLSEERLTLLKGRVLNEQNQAIDAVKITVKNHPEFGHTLSRENGEWILVVNGGGDLFVEYEKIGYLKSQRPISTEKYIDRNIEDVILVAQDSQKTIIDLNSSDPQLHVASVVTDESGSRSVQVLIPENTTAQIVFADGSTRAMDKITVRATEFTVGSDGPKKMPAQLPPRTGYTYAAEFNADEAIALGGGSVEFSKPVPMYVDNFLNFPTGSLVPVGYLNPKNGFWEQKENAVVIGVLSVDEQQKAMIDVKGNGVSATQNELETFGITDSELKVIGSRYAAGQSFWRGRSTHFSTYDFNPTVEDPIPPPEPPVPEPPVLPPPEPPIEPPLEIIIVEETEETEEDTGGGQNGGCPSSEVKTTVAGCVIHVKEQILKEGISLKGTGHKIKYSSHQVTGRKEASRLVLYPHNNDTLNQNGDAHLISSKVTVEIAGKKIEQMFSNPNLNDKFEYIWDGLDVFGRKIYESQEAKVTVDYIYPTYYKIEDWMPIPRFDTTIPNSEITLLPARDKFKLAHTTNYRLSSPFDKYRTNNVRQFHGWNFGFYHTYDPVSKILYKGNGEIISEQNLPAVVTTIAGNGVQEFSGENIPAVNASMVDPVGLARDHLGNLYISDIGGSNIRKIDFNGIITTIVGDGTIGYTGDGGLAVNAKIGEPVGIATAEDGSIYFNDHLYHVTRKIDPNGIITTIAGNGTAGFSGDGGPALNAQLSGPRGLVLGKDGSLYISDSDNNRIRRLWTNGIITTMAGTGNAGFSGDGGPAENANLSTPNFTAIDKFGNLYVADTGNNRVRKISPTGIITTIAGNGNLNELDAENVPAVNASLQEPLVVAVGNKNEIYINDGTNNKIRKVDAKGRISTVIGTGAQTFNGDGRPGTLTNIWDPLYILVDPINDDIIFVDRARVRKLSSKFPNKFPATISSANGAEIYYFNASGTHFKTLIANTGSIALEFIHDANQLLVGIKDRFENLTQITRDSEGRVQSLTGPYGQIYTFEQDSNNYLSKVTNPLGDSFEMTYTPEGLLTSYKKPEGNTASYEYSSIGSLIKVTEPDGGVKELTELEDGSIQYKSGENVITKYQRRGIEPFVNQYNVIKSDGSIDTLKDYSFFSFRSSEFSDGRKTNRVFDSDPRFPGNSSYTTLFAKDYAELPNSIYFNNTKLEYQTHPDGVNFNKTSISEDNAGYRYTQTYNTANRTTQSTTGLGRQSSSQMDANGQLLFSQNSSEFLGTQYSYNSRGRLTQISQGDRVTQMRYDDQGFLNEVIDAENRSTKYINDALGRVLQTITPDDEVTSVLYDKNSNVIGITPPQRLLHRFIHNSLDLLASYTAPDSAESRTFEFDSDKRLVQSLSEENKATNYSYGSTHLAANNNKLTNVNSPELSLSYQYHNQKKWLESVSSSDQININYSRASDLLLQKNYSGRFTASVQYDYQSQGFLQASENVNSQSINQIYDADKLLIQTGDLEIERTQASGLPIKKTLGAFDEIIQYSSFGEISSRQINFNDNLVFSESYIRDRLGRIITKSVYKNAATTVYNYSFDLKGRLKTIKENGNLINTYNYDVQGNRTSIESNGQAIYTASYDSKDRLLNYTQNSETFNYTYAKDDSFLKKSGPNSETSYYLSQMNPLQKVEITNASGTKTVDYWIDGELKRSAKLINGVVSSYFVYDKSQRLIAELDLSFAIKNRFVYGLQSHSPDYMVSANGTKYFFVKDQLGSILQVLNAADGSISQEINYNEFGVVLSDSNAGFQPFGYAGGHYDSDTGLVRFGARDYDSTIGRWIVRDPIGFEGGDTNLWVYAGNDPVNNIDPSGLYEVCTTPLSGFENEHGPIRHEYLCANGVCGGQTRTGNPFGSPGTNSNDGAPGSTGATCKEGPKDKKACMDSCIAGAIQGGRPNYSVINVGGSNCQKWASDTVARCSAQCGK